MLPFPQFLVGVCLCACVLTRMLGSPSDRLAVRLQFSKLSDLLGHTAYYLYSLYMVTGMLSFTNK